MRRWRDAFTLIELLVVLAILATLLALLLPAVQKVREAASRSRCLNNLRQIGLAMHAFHGANESLPGADPGYCCWGNWVVPVLPYLEQKAMFDLYQGYSDGRGGQPRYDAAVNYPVTTVRLPTLTCPSDVNQVDPGNRIVYYNYAANFGNTTYDQDRQGAALDPYLGVPFLKAPFSPRVAHAFKEITDGLSNTLLVAEVRQAVPGASPPYDRRGWIWFGSATHFETFYGPNSASADVVTYGCNPTPGLPCVHGNTDVLASRSRHAGGVNVALCDGASRFVSDNVDINTWRNLGSAQDGAALGDY
jgi:prepilin-type N-terminal cleavage/methylation domain-containing protein/prepilin-type processing-associated H-X9-DG protein